MSKTFCGNEFLISLKRVVNTSRACSLVFYICIYWLAGNIFPYCRYFPFILCLHENKHTPHLPGWAISIGDFVSGIYQRGAEFSNLYRSMTFSRTTIGGAFIIPLTAGADSYSPFARRYQLIDIVCKIYFWAGWYPSVLWHEILIDYRINFPSLILIIQNSLSCYRIQTYQWIKKWFKIKHGYCVFLGFIVFLGMNDYIFSPDHMIKDNS